ncbi:MAG: hypothetical protein SFX18_08140 [Pirellulales bacterium]|nr:hypothetical protein [Pirellulales bacterium]
MVWVLHEGRGDKPTSAPAATVSLTDFVEVNHVPLALDDYVAQASELLANPSDFEEAQQERLKKHALSIASLAMTLAQHQREHPLKARAAGIFTAAVELSRHHKDHAQSAAALKKLQSARNADPSSPALLPWQAVPGLGAQMKRVNELQTTLKRSLTAERFAKTREASNRQSLTLAAIALVTAADTHEVKNPTDLPAWGEYSAEFTAAAGQLHQAIAAENLSEAQQAMDRVNRACHDCHQKFVPQK